MRNELILVCCLGLLIVVTVDEGLQPTPRTPTTRGWFPDTTTLERVELDNDLTDDDFDTNHGHGYSDEDYTPPTTWEPSSAEEAVDEEVPESEEPCSWRAI